ncbi:hypothetical protein MKX03_015946 [Papaver bracteatum]|nr:hypothetical protein MKX03_015946 [Papaver bracteatum]
MKYMEDWVHRDIEKAAKVHPSNCIYDQISKMIIVLSWEVIKTRLLMCVIQMGDFEGYKDLVDRCPDILDYVSAFPFGGTPLHIAIKADPDEYHIENINDTYVKTKLSADKDDDDGHIMYMKDETLYYGLHTPLAYALYHDRISVINELLPIWWKSIGVLLKSRDLSLFVATKNIKNGEYSEALKLLMAWYMRYELSKSGDWDATNASQLASSYEEIVHHLLNPNILRHLSLFFVDETKEGRSYNQCSVFIEVTGSTTNEEANAVPDGAEGGKDGTNEGVVAQHPPNDEDCNEITAADNLIGNNSIMINQTYTSSLFGQKHSSAKECRDAILNASIRDKRYVKFEKSTRKLIIAKCSHESCKWRLDAKAAKDGFLVSETITEHTCSASSSNANNMATSAWVCRHIIDSVRQNPNYQPKEIIDLIEDEFQIEISYMTAYRAREQAIEQIHGSPTDSNNILPNYIANILLSNPDSIILTSEPTEDQKYHRVFISYKACINGFLNGCSDLVFFEKCPIKQGHEGNILAAIGIDGNNDMFPFAFAIVETDSKSAWEYFFHHLKYFAGDPRFKSMTIISNPSYNQLSEVIESYFSEAKHRPCTWHLAREMGKKFGSKIEYDQLLANLMGINETAAEWIEKNLPDNWATLDFQRESYIYMNINVAEAFSHWIQPSRKASMQNLPISSMLERISIDLTNMFSDRRTIAVNSMTCVTKYADKLIREADEVSKSHYVLQQGQSVYVVQDSNNLKYRVDLSNNSCSCLFWQKVGIPCSHALATIKKRQEGRPYSEFCKAYYSIQGYRMAYADTINLVLLDKPVSTILPIKRRISCNTSEAGRKKSKAPTETRVMRCSLCKKSGHTKKSCKSLLS